MIERQPVASVQLLLNQTSSVTPEKHSMTPVHTSVYLGSTKRTTLRLSDERQRHLEKAKETVADGQYDDPPNSDVIDAAQRISSSLGIIWTL